MKYKLFALGFVGVTFFSTVLVATTLYILKSDSTTTQTSGKSSGANVASQTISPGGDYQGLYELRLWENGDAPCKLQAKSRHLNTYSGRNDIFNNCDGTARSEKVISFTQQDTYIGGVQVCLNAAGNRVKGVKIFGRKLNRATGALDGAGTKKFERPNCKPPWKTARNCPAGKIATGVKVFFTSQQQISDEIGGLALTCRSVIKK